jgi:cytoskeletal protein CcmA (bactofilin family)
MNNTGTVIGKGICIRGEISGAEDFFLDGMVEGNITLDDKRLTIGPNGLAQADIVTGDLVVFGRVEGSVKASVRAELKHTASFTGDLVASRLSIEDSATMQGFVDLTQAPPVPKKGALPELPENIEVFEGVEPEYSEAI